MGLTFFVKTLPGERVEANITLPEPAGSAICGTVTRSGGVPAANVLVLLIKDGEELPQAQCTTDEHGLFCFGPLPEDQLYRICIFEAGRRVRRLEVQL